jgi:hypothetical protein
MGGKVLVHLPPLALPARATLGLSDEAAEGLYCLRDPISANSHRLDFIAQLSRR